MIFMPLSIGLSLKHKRYGFEIFTFLNISSEQSWSLFSIYYSDVEWDIEIFGVNLRGEKR